MKERPILFTPENVLKVRDRQKWQTRRVIDPQPTAQLYAIGNGAEWAYPDPRDPDAPDWKRVQRCPYGHPGDRLWVRESLVEEGGQWLYRSDRAPVLVDKARETDAISWAHHKSTSYASAIHMPRWAARLILEITRVRVERIQDITPDDMRGEGLRPATELSLLWREDLAEQFRALWDSINGDRGQGWEVNPWVWAIDFELL